MRNRQLAQGKLRRALPSIVLAMLAATMIMATTASADDPPIISAGPVNAGGTDASGSVGSNPEVDACIGDDHSGAGPADPGLVALNDSSCQSSGGPSSTGSTKPTGTSGTSGTPGASGTTNRSSTQSSVAAADAIGLRIVGVRKIMKNVRLIRNFRVIVTVKDTRGLRVRGAIVSVSGVPGSRSTVAGLHAGFSNKVGQARVLVPVTKSMFGKRLYVKIAARTPKARAVALRSVLLPRLR